MEASLGLPDRCLTACWAPLSASPSVPPSGVAEGHQGRWAGVLPPLAGPSTCSATGALRRDSTSLGAKREAQSRAGRQSVDGLMVVARLNELRDARCPGLGPLRVLDAVEDCKAVGAAERLEECLGSWVDLERGS